MLNIFEVIKNKVNEENDEGIICFRRDNRFFPWGAGIWCGEDGWRIGFGETKAEAKNHLIHGVRDKNKAE